MIGLVGQFLLARGENIHASVEVVQPLHHRHKRGDDAANLVRQRLLLAANLVELDHHDIRRLIRHPPLYHSAG